MIEVTLTLMIIAIFTALSLGKINLKSNSLSLFAEEFVADFDLYRSLTSEVPGEYSISFSAEGYSVLRKGIKGEDILLSRKDLPSGLRWGRRPREILFQNDHELRLMDNRPIMTIELIDTSQGRKAEITIVPVSARATIARYLDV